MSKQKILAADDDDIMRDMLRIFLEARGFEITTVENGKQAVEKEEEIRPDLVILDVDMPVMTGFDACPLIRHKRNGINYTPIIFLSGNLDERSVITGLQAGADDYIRKPFEPLELLNRIKNLLRMRDFIAHLESLENVIFSLVKSIEARDSYTAGHSMRVSNIAVALGRQRGLSDEDIESLRKGALLHDIGKIGVPDQILNKQGLLDHKEFEIIREHPTRGSDICNNLRISPQVLDIIRHHHEKLDGSGYPDHLQGTQNALLTRIVTVADMFDAMATKRPYHSARSNDEVLAILRQEASAGRIDATIIENLAELIKTNSKAE